MTKTNKEDFYRHVNPFITGFILIGLFYLLPCVAFMPQWLPSSSYTGFFGDFLTYLTTNHRIWMQNIFLISMVIHLFEAVFALMICSYLGLNGNVSIKWGLNVFVNGLFALRFLIKRLYEEDRDNKEFQTVIKYDKIK